MTSRRAMLTAMGGLPFARPDQHYEPPDAGMVPGSRSGVFRKVVIVAGSSGGLFVFSPTVGPGNLIASIAPSAGTIAGNAYVAGITSYETGGGIEAQLLTRFLSFINRTNPASVPPSLSGSGNNAGTELLLTSGKGTAGATAASVQILDSLQSGIGVAEVGVFGHLDVTGTTTLRGATIITTGGLAVTGGLATDTETATGLITASGGLAVTGGETADTVAITSGQAGGLLLAVTNTTGGPTASNVRIVSQTAGDPALGIRISGDTANRLLLDDNGATGGRIRTGPGGGTALDTAIFRSAAGTWAADPILFNNAGTAETKQAPTFANSWANTGAPGANLQYWRVAAPGNEMRWYGRITAPAGIVANQAIITAVPAAYRPSHTNFANAINVTTGGAVRLSFGSTGVLTFQSGAVAADVIDVNGLISLDA